jgi:hypothetical protein
MILASKYKILWTDEEPQTNANNAYVCATRSFEEQSQFFETYFQTNRAASLVSWFLLGGTHACASCWQGPGWPVRPGNPESRSVPLPLVF